MILINKLSVNTVVLTLSEKTTLDPVFYLFEFIKDGSPGTAFTFTAQDTSSNKYRYNQFYIEDGPIEDRLNGVVDFEIGKYQYNVYEQSSATNLVVANAGDRVENGRVEVKSSAQIAKEFNQNQTVIKQFNG